MSDRALAELARFFGRNLDEVRELYEERAGLRQYESGMSRSDAEREALLDVRRMLARERLGPRSAGEPAPSDRDLGSLKR
ncbi:MAG TPA: hypothetical protein VGL61_30405 [Kofleriaceae bacterium]|jgi:hypothetical protein|nr:hypothetical protein [Polyangiales bacterium]